MLKRLLYCKKSLYNKEKLLKDYRQSQSYKKNSCKFPSIDFYKTIRISKYSSSLNNFSNNGILFLNHNFWKQKLKNKTPYQKLFYSNEMSGENNIKNKLVLDSLCENIPVQKTVREHVKTHYAIKDFYEKKILDLNEPEKLEIKKYEEKE